MFAGYDARRLSGEDVVPIFDREVLRWKDVFGVFFVDNPEGKHMGIVVERLLIKSPRVGVPFVHRAEDVAVAVALGKCIELTIVICRNEEDVGVYCAYPGALKSLYHPDRFEGGNILESSVSNGGGIIDLNGR